MAALLTENEKRVFLNSIIGLWPVPSSIDSEDEKRHFIPLLWENPIGGAPPVISGQAGAPRISLGLGLGLH